MVLPRSNREYKRNDNNNINRKNDRNDNNEYNNNDDNNNDDHNDNNNDENDDDNNNNNNNDDEDNNEYNNDDYIENNYENNINYEENKNQDEFFPENEKSQKRPKFKTKKKKKIIITKRENNINIIHNDNNPNRENNQNNYNNNMNNDNQISENKSFTNEEINRNERVNINIHINKNEKNNKNERIDSNTIPNTNTKTNVIRNTYSYKYKKEQNSNFNKIMEINDNNIKTHLQNMFNEILYNSFDQFEKNITIKINQMNNRLNDISLKISDYQAHPNNINNLNNSSMSKKNKKIYGDYAYSVSSYKPQPLIENNTSFYINSKKMRLNPKDSKNQSINTEEPDFNINTKKIIYNINDRSNNIDSEVTKAWKETLKLIEKGHINEGYLKLINTGDDIYLLRLICLTGPVIDKLDPDIAKRVLVRVNMISKSHQIQQLLIGLIKNSIKNNVFQMLEPDQQNYILDSLYEFSGLNNPIANEAAELYTELTK